MRACVRSCVRACVRVCVCARPVCLCLRAYAYVSMCEACVSVARDQTLLLASLLFTALSAGSVLFSFCLYCPCSFPFSTKQQINNNKKIRCVVVFNSLLIFFRRLTVKCRFVAA